MCGFMAVRWAVEPLREGLRWSSPQTGRQAREAEPISVSADGRSDDAGEHNIARPRWPDTRAHGGGPPARRLRIVSTLQEAASVGLCETGRCGGA